MTNAIVTMKTIQDSFIELNRLEQAAKEIKANRDQGTIRAYMLVIAHLAANKAGHGKRDKIAGETLGHLITMGVSKAKARRYIEMSQAFRRIEKISNEVTLEELEEKFHEMELTKESDLRNHVAPKAKGPHPEWIVAFAKKLWKQHKDMHKVKGEIACTSEMKADLEIVKDLFHEYMTETSIIEVQDITPKKKNPKQQRPKMAAKQQTLEV